MLEAVLRRDRAMVVTALALVAALAWGWTLAGAGMPAIGGAMDAMPAWSLPHAAMMLLMWWVMMVAMMLPSATPVILLSLAIQRRTGGSSRAPATAALLAGGYLAAWGAFSLAATLAQWGLESTGLLSTASLSAAPAPAGAIVAAAGLYQLTPAKAACLRRCRSPATLVARHWRPGASGALRTGLGHGAWCVGCCWMLMALLFAGGIMNPLWIGGIALFVLLEKLSPFGERLRRAGGVALLAAGALLVLRAL